VLCTIPKARVITGPFNRGKRRADRFCLSLGTDHVIGLDNAEQGGEDILYGRVARPRTPEPPHYDRNGK
jgi:hypothetical protein